MLQGVLIHDRHDFALFADFRFAHFIAPLMARINVPSTNVAEILSPCSPNPSRSISCRTIKTRIGETAGKRFDSVGNQEKVSAIGTPVWRTYKRPLTSLYSSIAEDDQTLNMGTFQNLLI